jgi:hypothetical protein
VWFLKVRTGVSHWVNLFCSGFAGKSDFGGLAPKKYIWRAIGFDLCTFGAFTHGVPVPSDLRKWWINTY